MTAAYCRSGSILSNFARLGFDSTCKIRSNDHGVNEYSARKTLSLFS